MKYYTMRLYVINEMESEDGKDKKLYVEELLFDKDLVPESPGNIVAESTGKTTWIEGEEAKKIAEIVERQTEFEKHFKGMKDE